MTREELLKFTEYEKNKDFVHKIINKIYDDFEQQLKTAQATIEAQEIMIADYKKRIEELEALQASKSCDGCKWKSNPNVRHAFCGNCIRAMHLKDNYNPKDN